jgi:hypothetical protein
MNRNVADSNGEDARLRREAYGLPGGFLRRFWLRRKIYFLWFLDGKDLFGKGGGER